MKQRLVKRDDGQEVHYYPYPRKRARLDQVAICGYCGPSVRTTKTVCCPYCAEKGDKGYEHIH